MTTVTTFDLEAHENVDLTIVLTGHLREARLVTLTPAERNPARR